MGGKDKIPSGIFFISDICWRTSLRARTHIKNPNFSNFMQFLLPANEVWCKVMFLHVSVILSTREGKGVGFPVCITGHMTRGRRSAFRGRGVCIQGREVCIWRGGLHQQEEGSLHPGREGAATRGRWVCIQGTGLASRRGSVGQIPVSRTGKAGGTHPTGMLSCFVLFFGFFLKMWQNCIMVGNLLPQL